MTRHEHAGLGIGLTLTEDGHHLIQARALERMGYSTVWLAGGELQSLAPVADIIRATETVRVGTGIIPIGLHDDATVLATYADIERTDPGRFVVGLGAPQQGRSPMSAMDAFLDSLDSAADPIPQQRRFLAALGPKKLAMARQRFAGAIALLVNPAYTAEARRALGPDRQLIITQYTVVHTDAARARAVAREPLSFLMQVPGYRSNAERLGFNEAEIDQLDDRLVDSLVSWGTAETVAAQLTEHYNAGADQVVVSLLDTDATRFIDSAAALAERLIR